VSGETARFVVGIDLGTTNSAVASVDTARPGRDVLDLAVPQLVAPGRVEPRDTLPSFHYQPAAGELPAGALALPWSDGEPDHAVGVFARDHGAAVPGRLIASAKSWLSHAGVDRAAPLLPWHGAADVPRLSPVEASARYLAHVRAAWDHGHPADPLATQEVVLTVPASFDEVARELTVEAAARAGLPRVVLLEEPQAAFYHWIARQGDRWGERVAAGQRVLVCDVGGGTSDFTLIEVHEAPGGGLRFQRVAVGEHLILGGDNLDLALAHEVERRLGADGDLSPHDWGVLVRRCREAKERLLGDAPPERLAVNVAVAGTRLIGRSRQVELGRAEAEALLVDGFFPRVGPDAAPDARRPGFQEFGLPYAPDPGITRYLAAFLRAHLPAGAAPDLLLLNGGVFASPALQARLVEVLQGWYGGGRPGRLESERLDLAVARGAAYYGLVRRGEGVRISGGLAQAYYVGVARQEAAGPEAVCLLPAGTEEGEETALPQTFELLIRQPAEFPLFLSTTRTGDRAGALVAADPRELAALPPIRTVLHSGKRTQAASVRVRLHARRTEIGTLDLWCAELAGDRRWRLQFDARGGPRGGAPAGPGGEAEGIVDEAIRTRAAELVRRTFGAAPGDAEPDPGGLVRRLEAATELGRAEWPPTLLRGLWDALREAGDGRRRSPAHEARWLNLTGYALRPGFGLALDDWRVAQTWRLFAGGVAHPRNEGCRAEWWILWRRLAGGLTAGQQQALAGPLAVALREPTGRTGLHERAEIWRLLGGLELLAPGAKGELGELALEVAGRSREPVLREAALWALGRLGGRVPVYGPLNGLVPVEVVEEWVARLVALGLPDPGAPFHLVQLARRTGDRYRDLPAARRQAVAAWLAERGAAAHHVALVREGGQLRADEQRLVLGDALPRGLRIE
jgi:molecular chaperone DnaK (HSP70)